MKTLLETIAEARSLAGKQGTGFRVALPSKRAGRLTGRITEFCGGEENDPVSWDEARRKQAKQESDDEFEAKREPAVFVQLDPEDRTLTYGLPTEDIHKTIEALADDDEDFFLTGRHSLDELMLLAIGAVSRQEEAEDFIPEHSRDAELYYQLR